MAGDKRPAGGRRVDAGEDVHQRRLAATAASRNGDHLARLDPQVKALQRDDLELARLIDIDEALAVDEPAVHAIALSSLCRRNRLADRIAIWPTSAAPARSAAAAAASVAPSRLRTVGGMVSAGRTLVW